MLRHGEGVKGENRFCKAFEDFGRWDFAMLGAGGSSERFVLGWLAV